MINYSQFPNYKSILCLNGELPSTDFFINQSKPIIAADGAAKKLLCLGIKPEVIVGDFDSINPSDFSDVKMIHLPSQDKSDFQKTMEYMEQQNLLPTIVCGVNGGFLDHILHNVNVVIEKNCMFFAPPLIGYVLKEPKSLELNLIKNTKISIIGMPKAVVSSNGLKWELEKSLLEFPGYSSYYNRTIANNVSIQVLEGNALILIYSEEIKDNGIL